MNNIIFLLTEGITDKAANWAIKQVSKIKNGNMLAAVLSKNLEKARNKAIKSNRSKNESTAIQYLNESAITTLAIISILFLIAAIIGALFLRVDKRIINFMNNFKKYIIMQVNSKLKLDLDLTPETKEYILLYALNYTFEKVLNRLSLEMANRKTVQEFKAVGYTKTEINYIKSKLHEYNISISNMIEEEKQKASSDPILATKITIVEANINDTVIEEIAKKTIEDLKQLKQ